MSSMNKIDRRSVLKGIAGTTLVLPILEAMGDDVVKQTPLTFNVDAYVTKPDTQTILVDALLY